MTPKEQLLHAFLTATPRHEQGHAVFDIADSKLWYLSEEQAREFLERRNTEFNKFTFVEPETDLLVAHAKELDLALPFTLVDLGCGDGLQAAALIPALRHVKQYIAVDVNPHFLQRATDAVKKTGIPTVKLQQQFEQLTLPAGPKVVLLLGNTVGNFEYSIIDHIAPQLQQDDLLVVGNCAPCDIPLGEHVPSPWVLRIPEYLGIPLHALRLFMKRRGDRYEDVFVLQEDITVTHNKKSIALKRGDEIIAAMYHTPSAEEIREQFSNNFDVLHQRSLYDAIVTVGKKK